MWRRIGEGRSIFLGMQNICESKRNNVSETAKKNYISSKYANFKIEQ